MGTQICKGIPAEPDLQNKQKIPKLSNKIQTYINEKKPFQQKTKQTKKVLKTFQSGVYQGPLNFMNNPGGYGKLYKNDGSLYIGEFINGQANGEGVYILADGTYLQGQFSDNTFSKGIYHTQGFTYNGDFKANLFDGKGTQQNVRQGYQFEGVFRQGRKISGIIKWNKDQIKYVYQGELSQNGHFKNGGKLIENPIGYYIGEYKNNKKDGKGTYQYQNGIKYVGDYGNGHKQGHGIIYNSDQTVSYEGQFKSGLPHGKGKATDKNKQLIESNWIEGIDQQIIDA